VSRLGAHHFAHLRAVAEGLDIADSARRYLGIGHGHEARSAHLQTVESVRAIARRRGESAWRLIGLTIALRLDASQPTLEDFIAERDLDGWSESDVAEMYAEAYPTDSRSQRRQHLRERQLALIRTIQNPPSAITDMVSGWFDDVTSKKLISAGMLTLGDLNRKIARGGRWFSALPAIGKAKAQRIAAHLATLLPRETRVEKPVFALVTTPSLFGASPSPAPTGTVNPLGGMPALPAGLLTTLSEQLSGSYSPALPPRLLAARNDAEAVEAWVKARAGSPSRPLVTAVRRPGCCCGCSTNDPARPWPTDVGDFGDFMAFLQNLPAKWISRTRAKPGTPGWAPFRGPLSHTSHKQAVIIVAALLTFLQNAQYLNANPWPLINQKTGDDRNRSLLDSKALSESAMGQVLAFVEKQPPAPARARFRFIVMFLEAVGLRSAELLGAKLGDFTLEPEGWVMQVFGKGARNRLVTIPGQAFEALQDYLEVRGLGGIETAPPQAPLLASTRDPMEPIGYQSLYEHVKGWLNKAVTASALPSNERLKLAGASTHWLRHTFGTRAVAREVPVDVIQAQLGHATIQTTMDLYGRAPIKRRVDELGKAFG
jgi:integrase